MKNKMGILSMTLIFGLVLFACNKDDDDPPPATVTGVTVAGPSTIAPGASGTFTATVTETGGAAKTVTWTSSSTKSSINASGTLSVAADEAENSTITVTATSTADASKTGTATVTVRTATAPPPANPLIGSWIDSESNSLDCILIFTATKVYYSNQVIEESRRDVLDTDTKEIQLKGPNTTTNVTYKYYLEAPGLVIKQGDTVIAKLSRIDGSTKTGIEDVWYSDDVSTAGNQATYMLIITTDKVYYNYTYNRYWKYTSYTLDASATTDGANKKLKLNNWGDGNPIDYEIYTRANATHLEITLPRLPNGATLDDMDFTKSTAF
jgi:uncharacterized protein YjdB